MGSVIEGLLLGFGFTWGTMIGVSSLFVLYVLFLSR